jgi:uncharacterized protein YggE
MGRSVTVTGQGEASAPYDLATLALGVTARAAVPADATARAGYALGQVRDAVLSRGVPPTALSTGAVSLTPVHDPWPTVVAYEASFALRVSTEDIAAVGSLLVAAVDAGGDGARVDGVTFGHRDAAGLDRAARDAAYADALVKAQQYAGLAAQALGEVRHVVEGAVAGAPRPLYREAVAASASGVPLDGGEGSVSAVVTVTWALGPAV